MSGVWREQGSAIEVNVGVDRAKSEIKVENRRDHEWSAEDFSEVSGKFTIVGTLSSLASPHVCNVDIRAYICFLIV